MHSHKDFFLKPNNAAHRQYEALRAFYVDRRSTKEVAETFGYSENYFNKLRSLFRQRLLSENPPTFFAGQKYGPESKEIEASVKEQIIALRKQNYSILEIQAALDAKGQRVNLMRIDQVLKDDGFARLPRRTRKEKEARAVPQKLEMPRAEPLDFARHFGIAPQNDFERTRITTRNGGVMLFYPLLQQLGIDDLVRDAGYPATERLTALHYILSFVVLKLQDKERLSHVEHLCLDKGVGLFCGLSALPKSAALSSYSYNVTREMNRAFLKALARATQKLVPFGGDFNLDFTAIPHWGDASILEKNWQGARHQALKSVLSFLAQDPETGILSYGNAEIKHQNKNDEVLTFVDFWKESHGHSPKCLIFDSRLTTYENLSKLNQDGVNFITLRRRGKSLVESVSRIPKNKWQTIIIDHPKRKYQKPRVYDSKTSLTGYKGKVRQLVITNIGREKPVFLITNDFSATTKALVVKYARRWLVEKSISESIDFFHLNLLSSSIVVKVDFDLTMTILASTLYRLFAREIKGFEAVTAKKLYQNFINNGAEIEISETQLTIFLQKKVHNPILFEANIFQKAWKLPWFGGIELRFERQNST
jgi:hypothetical protein